MGEVVYVPSKGLETRESLETLFTRFVDTSSPNARTLIGAAATDIAQTSYKEFIDEVKDRLADQKLVADVVTNLMAGHHEVMLEADDVELGGEE